MTESTERFPRTDEQQLDRLLQDDQAIDPQDLVYKGGYRGNPRDIVENPAVAPEMLNQPGDLQADLRAED